MQQSGYHHANSLATKIRNDIQCRDAEVLSVLQLISDNSTIYDTPSQLTPTAPPPPIQTGGG